MAGRISNLTPVPFYLEAEVQPSANSAQSSAPPITQTVEEAHSSYEIQLELLTQLKPELVPGGDIQKCLAIFSKLRSDVRQWIDQFCVSRATAEPRLLRGCLFQKMNDLLLYVKSRVPTLEERTEQLSTCLPVPHGVATLISKYAMERFDSEMIKQQQWVCGWDATPVTFAKSLSELRDLVKQKVISGAETEKPVEEMNEVECANFLEGVEVCRVEHSEPSEELYECLNRRVRPQDKLLAGFTCTVTYIPQYVRRENRIFSVTAVTLASEFGPRPIVGESARLHDFSYAFNVVLTREDANRTEPSCYFVMERDVAPDTRGKKPSVLIAEIASQGDKGWQLPEPRNFFAAAFARCAWKNQFICGREPWTCTYGQGTSRQGQFLAYGAFDIEGLRVSYAPDEGEGGFGACSSRKFRLMAPAASAVCARD